MVVLVLAVLVVLVLVVPVLVLVLLARWSQDALASLVEGVSLRRREPANTDTNHPASKSAGSSTDDLGLTSTSTANTETGAAATEPALGVW